MAAITAELVKELREKTGAGMMDCKKALSETQGDLEKAIEHLRKQGIASAAKKAGRIASEGLVEIRLEGNRAAMVEVNCETDFVAKNSDFQAFLQEVAQEVLRSQPKDLEELLQRNLAKFSKTVDTVNKELVAKIGENISVRRFVLIEGKPNEKLGAYLHMGNKIGAVVKVSGDPAKLKDEVLKDIAMHIAAVSPRFVRASQIPEDVRAKEREIYLVQMQGSGKPPEVLNKIIDGKLAKFASEVSLEEQVFVKDPSGKKTVAAYLKESDPSAAIQEFVRYQVGEGMAKKEEDFAAEVAKQLGK